MAFFNWFRAPLKSVRLLKGNGGKFRWTARIDGEFMALCRPKGYETLEEARAAARATLGGGWEFKEIPGVRLRHGVDEE